MDGVLAEAYYQLFVAAFSTGYPEVPALRLPFERAIRENLADFGVFKTFAQRLDLRQVLVDEQGVVRTFSQFKKAAGPILDNYNRNWLTAEYNATVAGAQMSELWHQIEDDAVILPLLKYDTVGDERVRPEHVALDGIVRPVGDPFWAEYYPPNGWSCRCTVQRLTQNAEPLTTDTDLGPKVTAARIMPEWRGNVGITGQVFNDQHPYVPSDPNIRRLVILEADREKAQ